MTTSDGSLWVHKPDKKPATLREISHLRDSLVWYVEPPPGEPMRIVDLSAYCQIVDWAPSRGGRAYVEIEVVNSYQKSTGTFVISGSPRSIRSLATQLIASIPENLA
jgi:hypothetical protein